MLRFVIWKMCSFPKNGGRWLSPARSSSGRHRNCLGRFFAAVVDRAAHRVSLARPWSFAADQWGPPARNVNRRTHASGRYCGGDRGGFFRGRPRFRGAGGDCDSLFRTTASKLNIASSMCRNRSLSSKRILDKSIVARIEIKNGGSIGQCQFGFVLGPFGTWQKNR